jgi:hypothetical protein
MRVQTVRKNNDSLTAGVWRSWNETGENLQRLATALGGCNVILQSSAGLEHLGQAGAHQQPPITLNPTAGFKTCRCQGANKDCCFCDGRGFDSRT